MDIWLVCALVAWIPVAALLALLVGRTVVQADRRERAVHPLQDPVLRHPAVAVSPRARKDVAWDRPAGPRPGHDRFAS